MRSRDGAFWAAARPAAASVRLEDQVGLLAAAALVDSGELGGAAIEGRYLFNSMHDTPNLSSLDADAASAGAATEGEFLCDALHGTLNSLGVNAELGGAAIEGRYLFNSMHDALNSSGLVTDAASAGAATVGEFLCDALHGTSNSLGVNADAFLSGDFWLHDFEGHGQAAGVLGDTGSAFSSTIAFSCGDLVIHDSLANSLHHPIHACAHSCLDRCGEGAGVGDGGIACAPLSSLLRVPGVDDDEDDALYGWK